MDKCNMDVCGVSMQYIIYVIDICDIGLKELEKYTEKHVQTRRPFLTH